MGLVGSPRDWGLHRDETLPTVTWTRSKVRQVDGSFIKTEYEHVWRLVETDVETGKSHWTGLMTIYVDDLLVSAEEAAAEAALTSISKVSAMSVEKVSLNSKPLKYCGFEVEIGPQ